MPNWCSGNIRFRGKLEDICRLLQNELNYLHMSDDRETKTLTMNPIHLPDNLECYEVLAIDPPEMPKLDSNRVGWWYWNGTQRAFQQGQSLEVQLTEDYKTGKWIAYMDDFEQAWAIVAYDFLRYSIEYNVDIIIFGWECGMCFTQEVEIVEGNIVKDDCREFKDDWMWESSRPFMGG